MGLGYGIDDRGVRVRFPAETGDFLFSITPDRLWYSFSLPFNVYWRLFNCGQSIRGVNLTTHFHVVKRLRIRGVIPPPPHAFTAWCLIKHRDNLIFTFSITLTLLELDTYGERSLLPYQALIFMMEVCRVLDCQFNKSVKEMVV
jgi:hypothetical protein